LFVLFNLDFTIAISISPSQIMIPSNLVTSEDREIIIFLELEKNENTRKINFEIPSNYQKQVKINKQSLSITNKGKITLTLKNLEELESGEHNINILLLENKEILENSLNDRISIKIIVPENVPILNHNTTSTDENLFTSIFIIVSIIICVGIISITIFLLTHLNSIKKERENFSSELLNEKVSSQELKINNMIEETEKILNYLQRKYKNI